MSASDDPQVLASRPRDSVFVAANAGSGKTSTLVKRVARLLLDGARPEAVLCVTYTKAGAAEMQRRLFEQLGDWAVAPDPELREELEKIDERGRELSKARALFARALETPGGLKIQTLHAFCEQLLRRFPLEAGVSPGFVVLEDVAARETSGRARDRVAAVADADPESPVGRAYAHFSIQLDWQAFNDLFADFEARRVEIAAYCEACETQGGYGRAIWRLCGFEGVSSHEDIGAQAMARIRWGTWRRMAEAVGRSSAKTDQALANGLAQVQPADDLAKAWRPFSTAKGEPLKKLGTNAVDPAARQWLAEEQARLEAVWEDLKAARIAEDTVYALTLAQAYAGAYQAQKDIRGALDFGDIIAGALRLLTVRADAAWVLYKLDGGLDHILLDEAQDTAPDQWDILRALAGEFFTGAGASRLDRTVFAVGDEKQSIFSFQGARPERLAVEAQAFRAMATDAQSGFAQIALQESWRSTPEVLGFVDAVIAAPELLAGLRPAEGDTIARLPISHTARREPLGCVELWPIEMPIIGEPPDVWAPVDAEPSTGAGKLLAARIAKSVAAMIERGEGILDRDTRLPRPCRAGDVLILVRRRNALFEDIIRALKKAGVAVAGADRLRLSEHGIFADLLALARFIGFPGDDLALAGLLRSPFFDIDEAGLFDLAYERSGRLWTALRHRAGERPEWRAALDRLDWVRGEAARAASFDLYSRFLGRLDVEGRSMRQRLITRMGAEGEEALDAFLAQALDAEGRGERDLETFAAAMAASEIEIKREADQGRGAAGGEVRVMTVHGAKGLEAPIVILPDTTTRAKPQGRGLLPAADGAFLWAPSKTVDCPASADARQARVEATDQESARLLYVALTRARDRLIICGTKSSDHLFERSWREFIERAFDTISSRPCALEGGGEGRRHGLDPVPCAPAEGSSAETHPLPAWSQGLAPPAPPLAQFASPTSLGDRAQDSAPSPLAVANGLGRYRRGDLIHRLLERLPDLPPADRPGAAARILARERDLDEAQRGEMAAAALGVLGDARFAAVFGPGSRAEVALTGAAALLGGQSISGRIDRLVVEPSRVLVIDFKTNRPAPDRIEDADENYIRQMAAYWAVLSEIYPDRPVEAALVWTDGPKLMEVPAEAMQKAIERMKGEAKVGAR